MDRLPVPPEPAGHGEPLAVAQFPEPWRFARIEFANMAKDALGMPHQPPVAPNSGQEIAGRFDVERHASQCMQSGSG